MAGVKSRFLARHGGLGMTNEGTREARIGELITDPISSVAYGRIKNGGRAVQAAENRGEIIWTL